MTKVENLGLRLHELRRLRDAVYQGEQSQRAGKLLDFYTRIMTKLTESERCSIFINDPTRDRVWLKSGTGVQEAEIEVAREGSIVGKVIASGEPIIVTDLQMKSGAHKAVDEKTGFVTRNILCVPIKSPGRNEVTGAVQLLNKLNNAEFTEADKTMALEVAAHLQREVDTIFLDQEIFALSEGMHTAAVRGTRTMYVSIGAVAVAVVGFLMLR